MEPPDTTAYLILGSNHQPMANLAQAIRLLQAHCPVLALSSVYRTVAQGATKGGADYLNMAVKITTALEPAEFKRDVLRAIEQRLGRTRDSGIVTIDLDIAVWGDQPTRYGDKPWRSPSPDITRYAYAAVPLAEIAPDLNHPETGEPLSAIASRFPPSDVVRVGPLPV